MSMALYDNRSSMVDYLKQALTALFEVSPQFRIFGAHELQFFELPSNFARDGRAIFTSRFV
jgi:hypothetical protein